VVILVHGKKEIKYYHLMDDGGGGGKERMTEQKESSIARKGRGGKGESN